MDADNERTDAGSCWTSGRRKLRARPEANWARASPPRDDDGATALAPLLHVGQMSLGIHHRNSVVMSPASELSLLACGGARAVAGAGAGASLSVSLSLSLSLFLSHGCEIRARLGWSGLESCKKLSRVEDCKLSRVKAYWSR